MKKRFIIGIENLNKEESLKIRDFLAKNELDWWHWIDNFWLIIDPNGTKDVMFFKENLFKIIPPHRLLIMGTETKADWAGYGPKSDKYDMFDWLHNQWDTD